MCELAAEEPSRWLMVDPWEALQPDYLPTAKVLDHFEHEINRVIGGVLSPDGSHRRPVKIMLLAGADLIGTMSTPGVWSEKDLDHILGNFGAVRTYPQFPGLPGHLGFSLAIVILRRLLTASH